MYSQADIEEAVAAGALAPEQASNLRNYVAARNGRPTADEEYFRVLFGYNDLLVTYACFMALFGLALIGLMVPISTPRLGPVESLPVMSPIFAAAGAWGLSELFLRRRAFALTGIFLSLALGLAAFFALFLVGLMLVAGGNAMSPVSMGFIGAIGSGAAALMTWLHWRRFGVPAAVAWYLGFGALGIVFVILPVVAFSPAIGTILSLVSIILGILLFGYAMSWDVRDPHRLSTASEIGLWAHWPAGTLIAVGLTGLLGIGNGVTTVGGGLGAIGMFVLFALAGLIIDRRQYVLSALSPLLAALAAMFGNTARYAMGSSPFGSPPGSAGFGRAPALSPFSPFTGNALAGTTATFCIVAILLLLVVLFWQPLRRGLLTLTPGSWRQNLPGTTQSVGTEPGY